MVASPDVQAQVAGMSDSKTLFQLARKFETEAKWADASVVWRRLNALSPHNPTVLYNLIASYAMANDKSQAYHLLLATQGAGLGYDLPAEPRFSNLHGTEIWDYLVKLHTSAKDDAFGEGSVAFELPAADRLLESIAYDPQSKSFLLGSARDGVIYRRGADGKLTAWAQPQGQQWWSVFDIEVDAQRKVVWVTTAAIPHFKGFKAEMTGRSSLLKIDLATGKLIAAYAPPSDGLPHMLNSIALSSKGDLIVSEGMRGQLFKFDNDQLVALMAEPKITSIRGLAFSEDGDTLYFADYERGLFGLDLKRGTAFDIAYGGNVVLYGIEGLFVYENQLVAIQNGINPQRVMRFKLVDDGRRIEMGIALDAANASFATPTLGAVVDDDLYFIANSQRSYYDSYGLLKGDRQLPDTKVFKSNLRYNWDFKPPSLPNTLAPAPKASSGG